MTAADVRPAPGLLVAAGSRVLINRAAEAERLAEFITRATSRFVVLYGQPASGKTTLVKHWLLPALKAMQEVKRGRVYYGSCTAAVPNIVDGEGSATRFDEAMAARSIVILDEFDHVLDAPRDERRQQLDALFSRLAQRDCIAVVVAVVSERQLTSIYALTSYEPAIVNAVEPIGAVSLSEGLQRLCSQERGTRRITYSIEALAAIEAEAKAHDLEATFDFVKLIHARFAALVSSDAPREIGINDYARVGKLEGILREHIDRRIDKIDAAHADSAPIAQAILLRAQEAQARATALDLADIGPRLGVSGADVKRVMRALVEEAVLLRSANDQYQFQPPQLVAIVDADRASRQAENERASRMVAEGLRSWHLLGTFLPAARFAEIHRQRRTLILDDEAARFLLQCALRQDQPDVGEAAEYWLARVASPDDAIDVLLAALFDPTIAVRARAATLIGRFEDPLVRERLCVLALSDESADVRSVAIDSLARMANDDLLVALRREIDNPRSVHRENAVEALRLFPRSDVIALLRALVHDQASPLGVRERAVAVLASLGTTESVDALVGIAMEDPDQQDRDAAAKALARTATPELNGHLLSRLSWRRPIVRIVAMIVLLSMLLYVGVAILALITAFATASMGSSIIGWALFGLIVLTTVTGLLLTGIEQGRIKRRSAPGVLAAVLFTLCSLTFAAALHGVSHLMIGRKRRAATLLGLEVAGVVFYFIVAGAAESITGLRFVATIYRAIGVVLFGASYLFDVLRVALDVFVMRRAMAREARRSAIYRAIFGNPALTTAIVTSLDSPDRLVARRSRALIRRFGRRMVPSALLERLADGGPSRRYVVSALSRSKDDETVSRLAAMWPAASPSLRRSIAKTLARSPTAAAVNVLSRLSDAGARIRLRTGLAKLQYTLDLIPRTAQVAVLVLLPVVGMLMYHGGMMTQNHAWGEIILLRQPISSPERKVRIVDFLVDVYPDKSVDELRRLFALGQRRPIDPLHAAVTRGLTKILDSTDRTHVDPLRPALTKEMARFDTLLRSPDSTNFALGISVLGTMARSTDTVWANGAVQLITTAAEMVARMPSSSTARLDSAVQALSALHYDLALPALSRLRKAVDSKKGTARNDEYAGDMIQLAMNRVANRAFASLPTNSSAAERTRLSRTIDSLVPSRVGKDLVVQLQKQQTAAVCDRNADGRCDEKDDAIHDIEQNPRVEAGFRDLYRHYAVDSQYRAATTAFVDLVRRYPESIWPRKILSEIYHENLAREADSFQRSYDEMIALRQLPAYQALKARRDADYRRVEADFAEVALSAGRTRELEASATEVLSTTTDPTQRFNMTLFLYIGSVVDHDRAAATARLGRLDAIVDSLPRGFYNEWVYPGTRAFISSRSDLPQGLKAAMMDLCRDGGWSSIQRAKDILAANRRELAGLSSK